MISLSRYCYLFTSAWVFVSAWRKLLNFIVPIIALGLCGINNLNAEQRELKSEDSEKTDAILLLDASGSMLTTDPQRLRDEGAKLFMQFLKPGDRLAIVEFSNVAKVVRPLSDFDRTKVDEISKQISSIQSVGLHTDLYAGINAALQILVKEGRKDAGQVVILMSDGKMDPDPAQGSAELLSNKLFNELLPEAKVDGIRVHTLSFSESADRDILSQISASSDAMSMYTPNSDKIHESYAKLFLVVKKPQVLPLAAGKNFRIDGDVQEATFYINRENGGEISLTMPSGKRAIAGTSDDTVKWYRGQKFDVITVIRPEPGEWQISGLTSQDGFATLLTNLKLVTDWSTTISSDEDTLLQARLYESEKPVVLPEMTGAVKYGFSIIPTDRVSEPVIKEVLRDDGKQGDKIADDGIYSALVNLGESGDYMLKVLATAPTFDRFQQIPFRVKPRLINLIVSSHTSSKHDLSEKDDSEGHAHDTHSDADSEHASDEEEHAKDEETDDGSEHDYFTAKLSPEVKDLKNLEVKLVAVDKERTRYNIEMHETADPLIYEISASLLPREGSYEIQATLSGQNKSRKIVKASSKLLTYLKKATTTDVDVAVVENEKEIVTPKKEKTAPPSSIIFLIAITVWNLILAGVGMVLFKKAGSGPKVAIPEFESTEPIKAVIASLRDKLSITEVDLDDPMFGGTRAVDLTKPADSSKVVSESVESGDSAPQAAGEGSAETSPEVEQTKQEEAAPAETPAEESGEEKAESAQE